MASESKSGFLGKAKHALGKVTSGDPVAHVSHPSAKDFWPGTLDSEAKKSARILRTFFIDGFVVPYRTLNSIGNETLKHAKGVAVFTIFREGLGPADADGSGVVVLRLSNGQWSPPAGVVVHVNVGIFNDPEVGDAYDCLVVINEDSAVDAFKLSRCTLGDEVDNPTPGSIGGSLNDTEIKKPRTPVWMYVKSKGHWIEDAQLKGVTVAESGEQNGQFYGIEGVQMKQILTGEVQAPSGPASQLLEVLKAIESGNHNSSKLPASGKSPGDYSLGA